MNGVTGRASALMQERDDLRDEVHSLKAEAIEDGWHMVDPARRLRESAIRDGRFHDFQDANVILGRVQRMARRGGK